MKIVSSLNNLKELNLYKAGNPISKIEDGAFSSDYGTFPLVKISIRCTAKTKLSNMFPAYYPANL
jgi:hypothetical protein